MTLLAAFVVLLHRANEQNDNIVGTPIANQQDSQMENVMGFFANVLAMRTRLRKSMTFQELLAEVRRTALQAYEYQDIPFEFLGDQLVPRRSMAYTPIFQVIFALQNAPQAERAPHGLQLEPIRGDDLFTRFDVEVHAVERGDDIVVYWLYNADVFDTERMRKIAADYVRLLKAVAAPIHGLRQPLDAIAS
jgi:non-ribosomal peptide synthetase component F